MDKLLVICGPTATGKTKLAARLSKKFNGVIISADSRQVYKGLDIGTGKERPEGVEIFGYDLVEPDGEFSVSDFVSFSSRIIGDIKSRGKLPILVGGTGLYIKAVVDGIETVAIVPNSKLRKELAKLNTDQLFERLKELDPNRALLLNESDRKNPRRLIRAIEIAFFRAESSSVSMNRFIDTKNKKDVLFVGLKMPLGYLEKKIKERVDARFMDGMEQEVRRLLHEKGSFDTQAFTATGYFLWEEYLKGKISRGELKKLWIRQERQYAKRQLTWFKKDQRINWFDISQPNWRQNVENLVEKWYSKIK